MTDSVWEGANRAACGVLGIAGREHGEMSSCTGESRRLYSQKCEQHNLLVNSISVLMSTMFMFSLVSEPRTRDNCWCTCTWLFANLLYRAKQRPNINSCWSIAAFAVASLAIVTHRPIPVAVIKNRWFNI